MGRAIAPWLSPAGWVWRASARPVSSSRLPPAARLQQLPGAADASTTTTPRLWLQLLSGSLWRRIRPATTTATGRIRLWRSSAARRAQLRRATGPAHHQLERVRAGQPQRAAAAAAEHAGLRARRAAGLQLPVQQLHGPAQGAAHRHQLLRAARPAARLHQRRQEHEHLPQPELRLRARGHGHPDRRPAEPHEPAHQGQHPARHALARQGREAERLAVLPLFRARRANARPRRRRRRRVRRGHLPGRLPRAGPHRRRRDAPGHGAVAAARGAADGHLRLVPLGLGARPALHLLDAGRAQGAEPGQGGRPGPAGHRLGLRTRRPRRHGQHRHGLLQEGHHRRRRLRARQAHQDQPRRRGHVERQQGHADILRREHRRRGHGRHVLGLRHRAPEEPAAELRAVAQQHPRGAVGQVLAEAPAQLQPPPEYEPSIRDVTSHPEPSTPHAFRAVLWGMPRLQGGLHARNVTCV